MIRCVFQHDQTIRIALLFILLIISSPELLSSQDELIEYQSSRRPSVSCLSAFTIFKDLL